MGQKIVWKETLFFDKRFFQEWLLQWQKSKVNICTKVWSPRAFLSGKNFIKFYIKKWNTQQNLKLGIPFGILSHNQESHSKNLFYWKNIKDLIPRFWKLDVEKFYKFFLTSNVLNSNFTFETFWLNEFEIDRFKTPKRNLTWFCAEDV